MLKTKNILLGILIYYSIKNTIIEFIPELEQFLKAVNIIIEFIVLLLAIKNFSKCSPIYKKSIKIIFLALLVISTITFLNSKDTLVMHINGLRDYIFILSALIIYEREFSENKENFINSIEIFLISFSLIQIPVSFYQFDKYGAGDYVGGTLSYGGSGNLSLLCYLISFYFLNKYYSKYKGFIKRTTLLIFCFIILIPSFINETKISILLIMGYFLCMMINNRIKIGKIAFFSIAFFVVASVFITIYSDILGDFTKYFDYSSVRNYLFNENINYKTFNNPKETFDIPRFTKILFLAEYWGSNLVKFLFGEGYGILKSSSLLGGQEYMTFLTYLIGGSKNIIFITIIEGGISLLIFVLILIRKDLFHNKKIPLQVKRIKYYLLLQLFLIMLYNDALFVPISSLIILYLIKFVKLSNKISNENIINIEYVS